MRNPQILIATSFYNGPSPSFHKTEDAIINGIGTHFSAYKYIAQTSEVEMFRNAVVRFAINNKFDYIFFADADMSFPDGTVAQLLKVFEDYKDERPFIASGIYAIRQQGYGPSVYHWNGNAFVNDMAQLDSAFDYEHVFRADGAATGCMLIKTALFIDKVTDPDDLWFEYAYTPMEEGGPRTKWSEDMVFCKKCVDAGVKVYINPKVVCGHDLWGAQVWPVSKKEFQVRIGTDLVVNLTRRIKDGHSSNNPVT